MSLITPLADIKRYEYRTLLIQRIGSAQWSSEPIDLTEQYMHEFSERWSGTIMPPSPGVQAYTLFYTMDTDMEQVRYEMSCVFRLGFKQMIKLLKAQVPEQITHRSRQLALGVSALRGAEIRKRLAHIHANRTLIEKYQVGDRLSHELFDIVCDKILAYLRLDAKWIGRYIEDHKLSSTGEGLKWSSLDVLTTEDWETVFQAIKETIEAVKRNEGAYLATKLYTGLRARSEPIDDCSEQQRGTVDRTRIIMFHPSLSLWTLFIPEKKYWYRDTLTEIMQTLGIDQKSVHLPMLSGGGIYTAASELFKDYEFKAYDGKSWDAVIGTILGKSWNPVMAHIQVPMLPSGITMTSLIDTIGSLYVWNKEMQGTEAIILGDDVNVFGKQQFKGNNVMEYQKEDTMLRFILGVSYYVDENKPRLQGIKLTADRGSKAIHIPAAINEFGETGVVTGKHDLVTQLTWYSMYFGMFGKRTLLEAIQHIPAEEFKGPSEMIHEMAEGTDLSVDELIEWARDQGLNTHEL